MIKITAILEPQTDGTTHLPIPAELRCRRIHVSATLIPTMTFDYAGGSPDTIWDQCERNSGRFTREVNAFSEMRFYIYQHRDLFSLTPRELAMIRANELASEAALQQPWDGKPDKSDQPGEYEYEKWVHAK